ncbi:MAG: hypothetical protein K2P57_02620 [Burkholderiales bacterium]|nr:hypothetical protein [Burkholderiales bacterium]
MPSTDEQCRKYLYDKLTRTFRTTGMVAVSSGFVTREDMDRADEAALDIKFCHPVVCHKRLHFELASGEQVPNPLGMQSSRLDSVWQLTEIDRDAFCAMNKRMRP